LSVVNLIPTSRSRFLRAVTEGSLAPARGFITTTSGVGHELKSYLGIPQERHLLFTNMSGDEKILAGLGEYLLNHRDEIMSEWLEAVERNPGITSSRYMGYAELVDHLPTLFQDLAERLKNLQSYSGYKATSNPGRTHGKFRWRQGYRLAEVIREAGIIRWILSRNWLDAFEREVPQFDKEIRRTAEYIIHEAVDDVIADSAEQYLEEQEKSVSHLNSQLADAVAELRRQKSGGRPGEQSQGQLSSEAHSRTAHTP